MRHTDRAAQAQAQAQEQARAQAQGRRSHRADRRAAKAAAKADRKQAQADADRAQDRAAGAYTWAQDARARIKETAAACAFEKPRNYVFMVYVKDRRPQMIRIKSITNNAAVFIANKIMDNNGKAAVHFHAEN